MKKVLILIGIISCFNLMLLNGCMRTILRSNHSLYRNFAEVIFEECDPALARSSIPANLKVMEGLLKSDPDNKYILQFLSMGYCGYALLFVETDDRDRASELYLRAKRYGLKALGRKGLVFSRSEINPEALRKALLEMGPEELEALFWFTLSWNSWLNLNLDRPAALGQLASAQACLERIMEINPHYFYGLPYVLMAVIYSARPDMLGGDVKKAESYFNKAFESSHNKFFLVHYYYARYYTVRIQDREAFTAVMKKIDKGDPEELKGVCLINQVMKVRSQELRRSADDLFL